MSKFLLLNDGGYPIRSKFPVEVEGRIDTEFPHTVDITREELVRVGLPDTLRQGNPLCFYLDHEIKEIKE